MHHTMSSILILLGLAACLCSCGPSFPSTDLAPLPTDGEVSAQPFKAHNYIGQKDEGEFERGGHRHVAHMAKLVFEQWYPSLSILDDRVEATLVQFVLPPSLGGPTEGKFGPMPHPVTSTETILGIPFLRRRTLENKTAIELIKWGVQNEDEFDYIYGLFSLELTQTHFWNADDGALAPVFLGFLIRQANAWMKAADTRPVLKRPLNVSRVSTSVEPFWTQAIFAWNSFEALWETNRVLALQEKAFAFDRLGHVVHLMHDLTLPTHAHMDIHGPNVVGGWLDGYEEWTSSHDDNTFLDPKHMDVSDDSVWTKDQDRIPYLTTKDKAITDEDIRDAAESLGADRRTRPLEKKYLYANQRDIEFPMDYGRPRLFYLFYTANQYGDYWDSWRFLDGGKEKAGDSDVLTEWIDYSSWLPRSTRDPSIIADSNYRYAVRATAAMFELFFTEVGVLPLPRFFCPEDRQVECGSPIHPIDLGRPKLEKDEDQFLEEFTWVDEEDLDSEGLGTVSRTWSATHKRHGYTLTCVQTITIVDTTPPVITFALRDTMLWPATGELQHVGFSPTAYDACAGFVPVSIVVYSNEDNGTGPHSPDATIDLDPASLRLRAERDPAGDGRIYLIVMTATDGTHTAVEFKTVIVPQDATPSSISALRAEAAALVAARLPGAPPLTLFPILPE